MICKLKTLALAIAAILAIGAVAASAASAQQGFGTSDGPVTLVGTETGKNQNAMTAFGLEFECPGSVYTGHKVLSAAETAAGKKHEILAKLYTSVTITPHYNQATCNVAGLPATIDMNKCDYAIRLRETSPKGNKDHTYAIEFDIVCPAGSEIEVTIFAGAGEHNNPMCILSIPPQFGLMGGHAKDTTNGHIDLIGAVKGIKVVQNGGFLCAPSETTGELDLDITVSGRNAGGGATPISISEAV